MLNKAASGESIGSHWLLLCLSQWVWAAVLNQENSLTVDAHDLSRGNSATRSFLRRFMGTLNASMESWDDDDVTLELFSDASSR